MNTGAYISGAAHVLLILWALIGGFFLSSSDPLPVETMDVSVLSVEEFEALTVPDLPQPEVVETPQEALLPSTDVDTVNEPEAEQAPQPTPAPEPPAPPPSEAIPDAPESPEPPTPPEADRVAPDIAPETETPVEVAPEVIPEVQPAETGDTIVEPEPAAAPEEAAPEIVTEAETPSSAAPLRSLRPMARPSFQQAAATEQPEPEQPSDAINDALVAALTEDETPRPVPTGPPLSRGEKDALRVAVGQCWNTGSLSTEALQTTVTVYVAMNENGTPDAGSLRMMSFSGGSEAAADRAYEAARRAIIRCGARGFNLPREKYSQWAEIEMIFNPNEMRIK